MTSTIGHLYRQIIRYEVTRVRYLKDRGQKLNRPTGIWTLLESVRLVIRTAIFYRRKTGPRND
ncbi:hypothetical protein ACI65C_000369 [Semiaphis heraclei]